MDQFTMAEFAKNSENKEGSSFTPAVQEEGIEQGSLIVSRLYNTMLGEITRALKSWNAELTKILEEAEITPSSLSNEQLYTAITKMINQSSGHTIGEIINSPIPLVSAGMHLLDGSLITGDGVYAEFVDYMAELYESSTPAPSYFTTESAWQTSVTQYGVCSKFVYDAYNNTVRLPKLYNTERYLIKSYKNGDAWYRIYNDGWCEQGNISYISARGQQVDLVLPFVSNEYNVVSGGYDPTNANNAFGTTCANVYTTTSFSGWTSDDESFNAGYMSWTAVGYVDISSYNVIPLYQYIALTQAPRTDIQIDVDNIITELNGKVDKSSLEEVHCVVETYNNGSSWYRIYDDGWCEQGGVFTGDFSTGNQFTLLQPYKDTNYTVITNAIRYNTTSAACFGVLTKTTEYFTGEAFRGGDGNIRVGILQWEAKGYIE